MNSSDRAKNLAEAANKGKKAAEVLENSEFNCNFDIIMEEITRDLIQLDTSDAKKMLAVVTRYQVASKFKSRLIALMKDGQQSESLLTKLINKVGN